MNGTLALFRRVFAGTWRGLIGWIVGVVAALLLYLPLYSSFAQDGQFEDIMATMPQALVKSLGYDQLGTGAGYAQGTFFGLIGFVLLTIATVGWGTSVIASDEENGQLELTLAHAVSRGRVLAERTAAVVVKLAIIGVVIVGVVAALNDPVGLGIEPWDIVAGTATLLGLAMLSASAAIGVGAMTGSRTWSIGAGAGIAVVGYVLNAVGNQSADLEWLHQISPYSWAWSENPLAVGPDWMALGLLYGISLLLLVAGWLVFRRRDIAT
ncbi:ABC transporter permease subunit [Agromyces sp. SYSU T00194]|uniref:ABC transporter permease subunit n=1 Tax=Agromyces chitinivorans TaxID=3158560 RepID=UPI0033999B2B